jgi:hypothetical protein
MVSGILFLDPLSVRDNEYKTVFTPEEQKKSGFNKSENLVIMEKLAKLHLGFIIRAVMKKAPPFYYYDGFSEEAKRYILSSISKPDIYASALEEYRLAHEEEYTSTLRDASGFHNIPIVLVTHTPEYSIRETMEFGQTDSAFAERVEEFWQSLMKDYLSLGGISHHIQARNSGHYIHLCEPEDIDEGLKLLCTAIGKTKHTAE